MYKNIDVDYLLRDAEKAIEKQDRFRILQAKEQQIRQSWGKPIRPVCPETRQKLLSLAVKGIMKNYLRCPVCHKIIGAVGSDKCNELIINKCLKYHIDQKKWGSR